MHDDDSSISESTEGGFQLAGLQEIGRMMERPGRRTRTIQDESRVSERLRDGLNHYVASVSGAARIKGFMAQPTNDESVDASGSAVDQLAVSAFDARRSAMDGPPRDVVLEPAVPILYFGDRQAYASSPRRIITVALNPSKAEFPSDDPFARFPLAADLNEPNAAYLAALDTYFKTNPYRRWFSSFEALLEGLDASYYPGGESTALHTDLCSPVATDPTWSRIGAEARSGLIEGGVPLWHQLVEVLAPHIVLISVAREHLKRIEFESSEPFEISRFEAERRRPYVTEGRWVDVGRGERSLLVFGRAANQPFGLVSHMQKTGIGGRIAACLRQEG